jgi:hypothetical protein
VTDPTSADESPEPLRRHAARAMGVAADHPELQQDLAQRFAGVWAAWSARAGAFLSERVAAMRPHERPDAEGAEDLRRRLLHAAMTLRWDEAGSTPLLAGRAGTKRDRALWAAELDAFLGGRWRVETLLDLRATISLLDPATAHEALAPEARLLLALAWPEVLRAWRKDRTGLARGPIADPFAAGGRDFFRPIGRKVPPAAEGVSVKVDGAGRLRRFTVECAGGRLDLFHPPLVSLENPQKADVLSALTQVLGPRALKTWWTCIRMADLRQRDLGGGHFWYRPGEFADMTRPRVVGSKTNARGRHNQAIISALDEDLRRLAQTRATFTWAAGGKTWTLNSDGLLVYQRVQGGEGSIGASLPADEFGPTRETRAKGRRPVELWSIARPVWEMMRTAGAFLVWEPEALRASSEAFALYMDLVRYSRTNPHAGQSWRRLVKSLVRDTGLARPDPRQPKRLNARFTGWLDELRSLGVLDGTLDGDAITYTLPTRHAAALSAIPAKRLSKGAKRRT